MAVMVIDAHQTKTNLTGLPTPGTWVGGRCVRENDGVSFR